MQQGFFMVCRATFITRTPFAPCSPPSSPYTVTFILGTMPLVGGSAHHLKPFYGKRFRLEPYNRTVISLLSCTKTTSVGRFCLYLHGSYVGSSTTMARLVLLPLVARAYSITCTCLAGNSEHRVWLLWKHSTPHLALLSLHNSATPP